MNMKKQIAIIHGGTSFKTYEDYLSYLKTKEISLEKLRPRKDWKDTLASELGDDYEILMPRMPNSTNARYKEWKLWFERIADLFNDNVVLIGHSLGGIFLAKYLSENSFPKRIRSTILVAAPFDDEDDLESGESLVDFALPHSLTKLTEQGGKIYLLHSKDDPVVPFGQLQKYQRALPEAETVVFEDREHFNQETFSEIIELIKSI
jgi:predicted alpha/beta hydrolase family esterase